MLLISYKVALDHRVEKRMSAYISKNTAKYKSLQLKFNMKILSLECQEKCSTNVEMHSILNVRSWFESKVIFSATMV